MRYHKREPQLRKYTPLKKHIIYPIITTLMLVMGIFSSPLSPQEKTVGQQPYDTAIKAFETFVMEQMAFDQTPGVSVGFIKDDFTWARGFGYADLENRVPATPASSYRMASITKTFTAIAVLQLAEAGKMHLEEKIQTYVPYFPQKKWPFTVRQLLGHLAGIPHYVDREKELHNKTHKNTREAIGIFQNFDLIAEPGTEYHYSSYGYNLLGAAIEEASGQFYGDYIESHIFKPLGMSDSRMDDATAIIPNRVQGYRWINGRLARSEFVDMSSRFAAGGTRSTVTDLLKYARGLIQGKLLSHRAWKQMLTPMATKDGFLTGRGMSWDLRPIRGHFQMSHGGSQAETKTYLLIFPSEDFAVAIASNLESFDREFYAYKLAEFVLEEDLDTPVYATDELEEFFYSACESVFSYGLSQYLWHSRPLTSDEEDLAQAFAFFNETVDPAAGRRNSQMTKNNILAGIHPVTGQAFTKVGSFMASELAGAMGKDKLRDYHKTGPIAFFRDFLSLSPSSSYRGGNRAFSRRFEHMFSRWEKDWGIAVAGDTEPRQISLGVDFAELQQTLNQAFSRSTLYPDFHKDIIRTAQFHLKNNNTQQAFPFLELAHDLYPNRISPLAAMASLYLWTGNVREARRFFHAAHRKDPSHPAVSIAQFQGLARDLIKAKKADELTALAAIIADLYPRSTGVFKGLGDMFLNLGQKDTALIYYKKALRSDRSLKDVRKKIKALEKERK